MLSRKCIFPGCVLVFRSPLWLLAIVQKVSLETRFNVYCDWILPDMHLAIIYRRVLPEYLSLLPSFDYGRL